MTNNRPARTSTTGRPSRSERFLNTRSRWDEQDARGRYTGGRSARSRTHSRDYSTNTSSAGFLFGLPDQARRGLSARANFDPNARLVALLVVFALIVVVFAVRLVYLGVIVGPENAQKAVDTRTVSLELPAKRGTIYDREGRILATNVDVKTIYCNPKEVDDPMHTAQVLADVLGGEASDYTEALVSSETSFAYIKRKVDSDVAEKLADKNLSGIYELDDTKRVYPYGQTAGQVIGMCDVDGNGLTGLELYYDDMLRGQNGFLSAERGMEGYPIAGGKTDKTEPKNGQDIVVSLDIEMQQYLEERLTKETQDISGKRGDALLYDGETGEIVAAASTPYLDPNKRDDIKEGATELLSISYPFEPGSIFKTVTMSAVLESGTHTPSDSFYCPGALPADEYYVTDAHARGDETMTLQQIFARSSNVGTSLAAQDLGFPKLYDYIKRYGLTEATGVDFPGESEGYSTDASTWSLIRSYNVSFGQGISVTPLQLARFYGAIANNGVAKQPHFLMSKPDSGEDISYDDKDEQIIENTDALPDLISMMKSVVSEGTGKDAQIEGFTPAGKTGTAEYANEEGKYTAGMYNISFIGFLPDTSSKLVCFVGVREVPGDRITTPAFKDIMTYAINHYRIAPR